MKQLFPLLLLAVFALTSCSKDKVDTPKYQITVTNNGNGTASANVMEAEAGATVTLTAIADDGYKFDRWTTNGDIIFGNATETATSFTMPAKAVNIKAEFVEYLGVLINGVRWSEYNVDAPGKFTAKVTDYGMFYQWSRKIGWSSSNPQISSPAGITWDESLAIGDAWETVNDPCPIGWRVATADEMDNLIRTTTRKGTDDFEGTGIRGSILTDIDTGAMIFFPSAGFRQTNGILMENYYGGNYWLNGPDWMGSEEVGPSIIFTFGNLQWISHRRSFAFSVRCVRK